VLPRRRVLLAATGLLALGGCTIGPDGTITLNLATAQAEATTIESAITAEYALLRSALPASVQSTISTLLGSLETAVSVFTSLPSGTVTYASEAQAVIKAAQTILPLLPLPPSAALAINEGLALISALVAGAASFTPSVAPAATGISAGAVVPGPIPVPLS